MPNVSIVVGLILIVIGALGYFMPEESSPTALIPAGIGLLFLVFGALAKRDGMLKHMMHAAMLLSLLAIGATITAVPTALEALQGAEVERPLAAYSKSATALVCVVFLLLAIKSFVRARARE